MAESATSRVSRSFTVITSYSIHYTKLYDILVFGGTDQILGSFTDLADPLADHMHQNKTVGHTVQTIFYSNSCHNLSPNQSGIIDSGRFQEPGSRPDAAGSLPDCP